VLNKILDEFLIKFPPSDWSKPDTISFPELKTYLIKYQDPKQADQITKVQEQLDETKQVMVN
jgi:synaptobrevin family protein YKT6